MKSFLKIICVAMTVGMFILGGCTQDVNDEDVFTEETESTVPAPHKKADGSKYRLAYVDYDEYLPASKQLGYILEGLEEYGWIKEGSLPFTAEEIDKKELSTKQIYERCLSADLGEYIEFVDGGFFYIGYDD